VKNRFQSLPFKCNLQRYPAGAHDAFMSVFAEICARDEGEKHFYVVGRSRLNQVDP
jgi:hypothetical protein